LDRSRVREEGGIIPRQLTSSCPFSLSPRPLTLCTTGPPSYRLLPCPQDTHPSLILSHPPWNFPILTVLRPNQKDGEREKEKKRKEKHKGMKQTQNPENQYMDLLMNFLH
jgi:hypothetical protein